MFAEQEYAQSMATDPNRLKPTLTAKSRKAWRSWLKRNHAKAELIWLVFFKKSTGLSGLEYRDSVEEALCFGWIDGLKKRIDEQRYAYRFTPRKAKSKWSPLNIKLATKMIEEGQMTPAGLAAFKQRVEYDEAFLKVRSAEEVHLPPEIEKAMKANKKAWAFFNTLAPGYRKQYVGWLVTAKKPETRQRRLKEAIKLLAANKKLGMK